MNKIMLTVIALCMVLLAACESHEMHSNTTYYVDSDHGLDVNKGTIDAPIKSLNKVNNLKLKPGDQVLFRRGTTYRGQLFPKSGSKDQAIYYGGYGEGPLPVFMSSINASKDKDWVLHIDSIYKLQTTVPYDVGNIIFNHGEGFGVKKWSFEMLTQNGDYFYDTTSESLFLYMSDNPWDLYESIECAVTVNIIDQSNCSYVTYENLALKYGSAHGIGGGNTTGITIRGLEISYIGGGLLRMDGDAYIQYGNGIEFWAYATDHLVEDCRIYEIFDTGVTNQNNGKKAYQERITYRNNEISRCSMASFELDNEPSNGTMKDIFFENNVCKDVGAGWGVTQDRYSDPAMNLGLGHHVSIFFMATPTDNVVIRDNVFDGAQHPDGYSSMYLFANIEEESRGGFHFENNEYQGSYDVFGYWVEGDTVIEVEDEFVIWLD